MKLKIALVAAAALAVSAGYLFSGPLNPPAGPISSTYKTLTEVEPRTAINSTNTPGDANNEYIINQPGSYYLTGNVTVPSLKNGIRIDASGVTLDLNGFSVQGSAGSVEGIATSGSPTNTVVKNGTVSTCGSNGIDLYEAIYSKVTDVTLSGNQGYGAKVWTGSMVRNCSAFDNNLAGFLSGGGCLFDHCISKGNPTGFTSQGSDAFESCVAQSNTGIGFSISTDTKVMNCRSLGNSAQGIVCGSDNWITGCQVHNNGGSNSAGIWVQGVYNHVEANEVVNNGYGIYVGGASNFIYRNKVGSSTQPNFYIVAGNHVGTIGIASANISLITGNSGGGLGSLETDPNANLIY